MFQQSLYQRLASLESVGVKLGLENINKLLDALHRPDQSFFSILIAGTNGKGSVGAFLESILRHHGYRTAYYSSPHLMDVRERFKVAGEMISQDEFEANLSEIFAVIDRLLGDGTLTHPPTHFETLTALAFHYFRKKHVGVAVVEVGLGGRFDATNALSQKLSIITTIGYDHEQYLGDTLTSIAAEKAAIMKPRTMVVVGLFDPEAMRVISNTAHERECVMLALKPTDFRVEKLDSEGYPIVEFVPWNDVFRISLRGKHQGHNGCVAFLACDGLQHAGFSIRRDLVKDAVQKVTWPGRLDIIGHSPTMLLDCAHNPMGVETLAQFLEDMRWDKVVALFTAMRDKNIKRMLSIMAPKIDTIFLTRVEPVERCANEEELVNAAKHFPLSWTYEPNPELALEKAVSYAREKAIPVVIFGSIYLAGKILGSLHQGKA